MPKPAVGKTSWDNVSLPAGNQAVIAVFNVENTNESMMANDNNRITQTIGNTDYNSFVQYQKSQADISVSQTTFDTDSNQ